jgi:hypothetical protein
MSAERPALAPVMPALDEKRRVEMAAEECASYAKTTLYGFGFHVDDCDEIATAVRNLIGGRLRGRPPAKREG